MILFGFRPDGENCCVRLAGACFAGGNQERKGYARGARQEQEGVAVQPQVQDSRGDRTGDQKDGDSPGIVAVKITEEEHNMCWLAQEGLQGRGFFLGLPSDLTAISLLYLLSRRERRLNDSIVDAAILEES